MLYSDYRVLSEADVEAIHNTSMKLLGEVGIAFHSDEAIAIFKKHGVKTDGNLVYLTETQVLKAVESAPAQFTIRARNPDKSVTVGDGEPVFVPGYGAPFLIDYEVGKRSPTMEDYDNLVRLADALPNQDLSGHLLVQPSDVPPETAHLWMLRSNMVHSDKPFVGSAEGAEGARHTMEMSSILFGESKDSLAENPVTIALLNTLSPLSFSQDMAEALLEYARWRQPVVIAAAAMAGATAPITLAGMLAQQNAEILAGITLAQLVSPGTPVVYGATSTNMDMKSGVMAIGSPELSLMVVATAQMARRYGLPSRSGGSLTDSHIPDARAGLESMLGLVTAINGGIDIIIHAGGILSSFLAFSYEKFVLDDEMCGMVRRLRQGIEVTPETLSYEVIADIGPGGNFLMAPNTLERFRTEFWQPALFAREDIESWQAAGRPDAMQKARQRWQKLLAEHEDPPLEPIVLRQLNEYVEQHT